MQPFVTAPPSSTAHLRVRALQPSDVERLADLYEGLSPRSRFLRFMSPIHRLTDSALEHLADIDHDRHEAIGVFDDSRLIASAHWFRSGHQPRGVEIAIEVADRYQRRGVGLGLLSQLGRRARNLGILEFGATMLTENTGAIALVRATGWCITSTLDGPELTVAMDLAAEA